MDFVKQNWKPLAAAGTLATLALAVFMYADPDECPVMKTICNKKTPFHNVIAFDIPQEEKEKIARSWMEKYVRSILLKKKSQPDSEEAKELLKDSEEASGKRERADSLVREGTGRFSNVDEAL